MKKETKSMLAVCAIFFTLGFLMAQFYDIIESEISYKKKLEGLWVKGASREKAEGIATNRDEYGNWVCVNIRDMDYERAAEICSHEVGHEIFAGYCEKNIEKCIGLSNE